MRTTDLTPYPLSPSPAGEGNQKGCHASYFC